MDMKEKKFTCQTDDLSGVIEAAMLNDLKEWMIKNIDDVNHKNLIIGTSPICSEDECLIWKNAHIKSRDIYEDVYFHVEYDDYTHRVFQLKVLFGNSHQTIPIFGVQKWRDIISQIEW